MKRLLFGALVFVLAAGPAAAVTLDNGLAGTSQFSVDLNVDATSYAAYIQAPGQSVENLMWVYQPIMDIGGSTTGLAGGSWIDSDPTDGVISSGGVVSGVNWTAMHSLPAGGSILTTQYTLTPSAGAALPAMRFYQYLDEDVYSINNNILVPSGSIAGNDLDLLTVHPTIQAGVSQSADGQATGWAADEYYDLGSLLWAGGYDAPAAGYVDTTDLPAIVDPYYGPAYGPADVTTAIEWEIPGGLQVFTFEAYLGGLPEAPPPDGVIPEPATMGLLLLGFSAVTGYIRRRRAA